MASRRVPVIALTGYLGAGKTTLLNHLLSRRGARIGVVVNDVGSIEVDAALVTGQIDEAASIAGGCICCLPDAGGLDDALERLTRPRLRLDAVVVEASGVADPLALRRLIRFSGAEHVRPGGLVDVVDAAEHDRTVDTGALAPARFAAATLAVINKVDRLPEAERDDAVARLTARLRERNPALPVIATSRGRIDPDLLFDVADEEEAPDELPLASLLRAERAGAHTGHVHADAVSVPSGGAVDADAVVDLLESPPDGVYRLKGCVAVGSDRGHRRHLVELVGRSVHIADAPAGIQEGLVAIGVHLDTPAVRARLERALRPAARSTADGLRRLRRHRRLSI